MKPELAASGVRRSSMERVSNWKGKVFKNWKKLSLIQPNPKIRYSPI